MQKTIIKSILSSAGFAGWQILAFPDMGVTGTAVAVGLGLMISLLRLLRSRIFLTLAAICLVVSFEPTRIVLFDFYNNLKY